MVEIRMSSRHVKSWMTAFCCIAAAGGCVSATPDGNDNAPAGNENDNQPAGDFIYPEDYATSFIEVRDCRFSSAHPENVRVLVNEIGADAYLNDENPLPEGTIVVKEIYEGLDCDGTLTSIAAMRKMGAGFDSEDGDWAWQQVDQDSGLATFNDKATCIGCHDDDECVARDYMCTLP